MGIVIKPPPWHYGSDCSECTPNPWPTGKTPMYVYAYFSGIDNCGWSPNPAPNGSTFLLQQVPGSPCMWLHQGSIWTVDFMPKWDWPDQSRVRLYDNHGWIFFAGFEDICQPEMIRYVNRQNECVLMYAGAGGYCIIDWSGILLNVVAELGILLKPKLMRESRYVDDTEIVYKVNSLYYRTNFKFKTSI